MTRLDDSPAASTGAAASASVSDLTTDERNALTAGVDMWHTVGVERLGIPGMAVTDGPSGARGTTFTGTTSRLVPCGTALASTWNPELIRRVGELLGDEARSKQCRVLLAPTVNIHRHPLGGRGFECYSEDPLLTAEIAGAFIDGVQSRGVGCAIKHFVANDQETDRMSIDAVVDEQALREIYLAPFEAAVRRAGVWAVMAAYNKVDGAFCTESRALLTQILRDEWGFDGVVVSDWFGVRSSAAIEAGLDLEMPGPGQFLGPHLAAAVEAGTVTEATVEASAERVLRLLERTTTELGAPVDAERAASLAREAACEGIVLLDNDGVLPLERAELKSIAVIGPLATRPFVQGGGSAQVTPPYISTPLQGLQARAAQSSVDVVYRSGRVDLGPSTIDRRYLATDDHGEPVGITVDFHALGDLAGARLHRDTAGESNFIWFNAPAEGVPAGQFSARATAHLVPDITGTWTISVSSLGDARVLVDGTQVLDSTGAEMGGGLMGLFTQPVEASLELVAGTTYEVVTEIDVDDVPLAAPADDASDSLPPLSLSGVTVEVAPPCQPDAVTDAVEAARASDVAVVVVGHDVSETEGADHPTIDLPTDQVALIRAVAAVNPATVVVINTGSPVSTDWADEVAATLQLSFAGQEAGNALAAVLFGDVDASGRLPTTYPRRIQDTPAFGHFPGSDGTVRYAEGMFVGYRHFETFDVEPRYCFGHGLSYTSFALGAPTVEVRENTATVTVEVTNTGERAGHHVVQVYVRDLATADKRPDRELRAFTKVALDPGEHTTLAIELDTRAFAHWDVDAHAWQVSPGSYEILIGSSSRAIDHTLNVTLPDRTAG